MDKLNIKKLKNDINLLCQDIKLCNTTLDEATNYIIDILDNIYSKKERTDYLFKPYIKQLIAETLSDEYGIYYNNFVVKDRSKTVEYLKTLPQHEQRTKEWYEQRINTVGASESAVIFGMGYNNNIDSLILKKLPDYKDESTNDNFMMKNACRHGTMCEPIVQNLYELKNNVKLYEFGSLVHPKYLMISASPDGITENGTMLEIKVPLRRTIIGVPTPYYWVQMQQQMQVCSLDRVHFLECKITIYDSRESYKKDFTEDKDSELGSNGLHKGVLITYINTITYDEGYIHPNKFLKPSEVNSWVSEKKKELELSNDKQFHSETYWKLEEYVMTEIWRDEEWWDNNKHLYVEFWDKVIKYRTNGHNDLIPQKKTYSKSKNEHPCLILSDDD